MVITGNITTNNNITRITTTIPDNTVCYNNNMINNNNNNNMPTMAEQTWTLVMDGNTLLFIDNNRDNSNSNVENSNRIVVDCSNINPLACSGEQGEEGGIIAAEEATGGSLGQHNSPRPSDVEGNSASLLDFSALMTAVVPDGEREGIQTLTAPVVGMEEEGEEMDSPHIVPVPVLEMEVEEEAEEGGKEEEEGVAVFLSDQACSPRSTFPLHADVSLGACLLDAPAIAATPTATASPSLWSTAVTAPDTASPPDSPLLSTAALTDLLLLPSPTTITAVSTPTPTLLSPIHWPLTPTTSTFLTTPTTPTTAFLESLQDTSLSSGASSVPSLPVLPTSSSQRFATDTASSGPQNQLPVLLSLSQTGSSSSSFSATSSSPSPSPSSTCSLVLMPRTSQRSFTSDDAASLSSSLSPSCSDVSTPGLGEVTRFDYDDVSTSWIGGLVSSTSNDVSTLGLQSLTSSSDVIDDVMCTSLSRDIITSVKSALTSPFRDANVSDVHDLMSPSSSNNDGENVATTVTSLTLESDLTSADSSATSPLPAAAAAVAAEVAPQDMMAAATLEALESCSLTPLIKEELKYTIQSRRLAAGKPELLAREFNNSNSGATTKRALTTEEKRRDTKRREQNRKAAQRFRQKQRDTEDILSKKCHKLEHSNIRLKAEILRLARETQQLQHMMDSHLCRHVSTDTH
ncbi:uncharacterized protein LOC143296235 [Babylonia areolata]|uniref:uncharacterized protein LOC143296235 n=1 Tax=Babylonia areolata TaxID=304850 RepID=UPI003FD4B623